MIEPVMPRVDDDVRDLGDFFFFNMKYSSGFHIKIRNNSFFVIFFMIHFLKLTTIRAGIWSDTAENAFFTSARL